MPIIDYLCMILAVMLYPYRQRHSCIENSVLSKGVGLDRKKSIENIRFYIGFFYTISV